MILSYRYFFPVFSHFQRKRSIWNKFNAIEFVHINEKENGGKNVFIVSLVILRRTLKYSIHINMLPLLAKGRNRGLCSEKYAFQIGEKETTIFQASGLVWKAIIIEDLIYSWSLLNSYLNNFISKLYTKCPQLMAYKKQHFVFESFWS